MQDVAKEIISKAAHGDIAAFEQIYKATSGSVYSIALRITRNREEAQDVTQEVFIKTYRELKNFNFACKFNTWVYRIAVNTAINAYNKSANERSKRGDYDTATATLSVEEKDSVETKDNEKQLAQLLDKLNPDQRTCILLREIEGLSYQQIAEALQTNINTVRTRLKRAREILLPHRSEVS